jgi:Tol biopolymer transport system component
MSSDGENVKNLTQNPSSDAGGLWSPTGMHIAFQSASPEYGRDLWVMDANGDNKQNIAQRIQDFSFAWQLCNVTEKIAHRDAPSGKN